MQFSVKIYSQKVAVCLFENKNSEQLLRAVRDCASPRELLLAARSLLAIHKLEAMTQLPLHYSLTHPSKHIEGLYKNK